MRGRATSLLLLCVVGPSAGPGQQGTTSAKRLGSRLSVVKPCQGRDFEAVVTAGKSVRTSIGGGLDFVLEAVPHGWMVRVLPSSGPRPEPDYAEVATPPFRSINPLLLTTDFGFRAQDVIGWNPRTFHYAAGESEYSEAQRAYRATISAASPTREQEAAVTRAVTRAREGRLEILDAVLTPGTADQAVSAGLVASHFASTAHTVREPESGAGGPLGQVLSLRFRVRLSDFAGRGCEASTKAVNKP